jgi:hypothetical protein
METDDLQSTDQTVSALSLSDVGEDGPATIDVSKLITVKVIDKRSSSSGVEYKCEFESLWLAADLAERAQIGRVHIRSYENGLVRDRRLKTLAALAAVNSDFTGKGELWVRKYGLLTYRSGPISRALRSLQYRPFPIRQVIEIRGGFSIFSNNTVLLTSAVSDRLGPNLKQ